jgi:hypothetical protein
MAVTATVTIVSPELRLTTARTVVRVDCNKRDDLDHQSTIQSSLSGAAVSSPSPSRLPPHLPPRPPSTSTQLPRLRYACTPILGAADNSCLLTSEF